MLPMSWSWLLLEGKHTSLFLNLLLAIRFVTQLEERKVWGKRECENEGKFSPFKKISHL